MVSKRKYTHHRFIKHTKTIQYQLLMVVLLDMHWALNIKMEYRGKSNKNGEIEAIKAKSSGLL